jgi:hypothetical protein
MRQVVGDKRHFKAVDTPLILGKLGTGIEDEHLDFGLAQTLFDRNRKSAHAGK